MNNQLNQRELRELSVAERLRMLEDVWQSLAETPEAVAVPDWHRSELDARLQAHDHDPEAARPWPDVKAEILDTIRK